MALKQMRAHAAEGAAKSTPLERNFFVALGVSSSSVEQSLD